MNDMKRADYRCEPVPDGVNPYDVPGSTGIPAVVPPARRWSSGYIWSSQ